MTVSELISYLNKFQPNTVVRAVDNNGNSSSFVLIREAASNTVEITGFPEYRHYYEKCKSDEYADRDCLPGPCNGDFLEGEY